MRNLLLLIIISVVFITSCKQMPKCGDESIKEEVTGLLIKDMLEKRHTLFRNKAYDYKIGGVNQTRLDSILNQADSLYRSYKLEGMRTVSIDKDAKKCDCEATFTNGMSGYVKLIVNYSAQ
ncbi:hypothetical protein, partial [Pedobacter sp.]